MFKMVADSPQFFHARGLTLRVRNLHSFRYLVKGCVALREELAEELEDVGYGLFAGDGDLEVGLAGF